MLDSDAAACMGECVCVIRSLCVCVTCCLPAPKIRHAFVCERKHFFIPLPTRFVQRGPVSSARLVNVKC